MTTQQGSVRKDKARGTWYFVIDAPGANGARRQVKRRGFRTRDDARDALDAFRRELMDGNVPVPADDTVKAFQAAWIAALPAEGVEPATVMHYRYATERLLPTIGELKLQDLGPLDLDRAYAALLDAGRSARTVRASHVAVNKMLTEAVRIGTLGRNVAGDARPPKAKAARARVFPTWTHDEMTSFLAKTADHEHSALWQLAAWTGMRRGELIALRWSEVDLTAGIIEVSRAVGTGDEGTYDKTPKTDSGIRNVEIDAPVIDVLKQHRKTQAARRLAIGPRWNDLDLVFCSGDGTALRPEYVSHAWSDLAKAHAPSLKLQVIRFHDLRHSHATQLLAAGVRPDVVTERLGHSSVAFTLGRYAHRMPGDQRSALARLRGAV